MSKKTAKPIIIKRVKKGGHGGHHGGSWKVAYADFVTAMMAFFMVMWILGMDPKTRKAVEGYFSNPVGYKKGFGSGSSPIASSSTPARLGETQVKVMIHRAEEQAFKDAAAKISDKLEQAKGHLGAAKFEVTVADEGLRIEMIDDGPGDTFFPSGSATVKPGLREGIELIGAELIPLHNAVIVEGHTDATRYTAKAGYSNWELSADRANAARRVLEESGLAAARIREVRGMADTKPRVPADPFAPQNRRITLVLPFSNGATVEATTLARPPAPVTRTPAAPAAVVAPATNP
jgi:chemotaxis protein MotB